MRSTTAFRRHRFRVILIQEVTRDDGPSERAGSPGRRRDRRPRRTSQSDTSNEAPGRDRPERRPGDRSEGHGLPGGSARRRRRSGSVKHPSTTIRTADGAGSRSRPQRRAATRDRGGADRPRTSRPRLRLLGEHGAVSSCTDVAAREAPPIGAGVATYRRVEASVEINDMQIVIHQPTCGRSLFRDGVMRLVRSWSRWSPNRGPTRHVRTSGPQRSTDAVAWRGDEQVQSGPALFFHGPERVSNPWCEASRGLIPHWALPTMPTHRDDSTRASRRGGFIFGLGRAKVAELVDARDLGSRGLRAVGVRVPPFAFRRTSAPDTA